MTHQPVALIKFHKPAIIEGNPLKDVAYCNVSNDDMAEVFLEATEFARRYRTGFTVRIQ